jgi:tetratricopeptide (TPR) repeat protein
MRSYWIWIFPFVTGLLLSVSCKNNKSNTAQSNPAFDNPALSAITKKIDNNPNDAALYFERGNILHKLQKDTLAIDDYKKAAKLDSTKAEYFSAVGNLLFDHKDISGSVQWIQKAIQLDPNDKKAHIKIAKMFVYLQDYNKALNEINTALRQDVYNPEPYFLKGMMYKDLKDTNKAISSFMTAIQVAPDYRDAMIQLGQLYSMKKDPVALKYYDNAFRLDTSDVFPIFAKGVFYQSQNDYAQAREEYKKCILRDNQYVDAYLNTGWILIQQDSVEKAWRQYNLVTQIAPNNAGAYYSRGLCSEMMNKKDEAIKDYQQALVFNGKYKEARDGLKRLGVK